MTVAANQLWHSKPFTVIPSKGDNPQPHPVTFSASSGDLGSVIKHRQFSACGLVTGLAVFLELLKNVVRNNCTLCIKVNSSKQIRQGEMFPKVNYFFAELIFVMDESNYGQKKGRRTAARERAKRD